MNRASDSLPGTSYPLGATLSPDGVNFAAYSRTALARQLLQFDHVDDETPSRIIQLDRKLNRTYEYLHI